jgi:beta-D-xylosidase 4
MWYTGTPVYQFGEGNFYTTFSETAACPSQNTFDIPTLIGAAHPDYSYIEQVPFFNFTATIKNTGKTASPYTAMVFASTKNAGPAPYPIKWLSGFDRLATIQPGQESTLTISIPLGALARVDESGDKVLYPGSYELALNIEASVVVNLELTGVPSVLEKWPLEAQEIPPST